VTRSDLGSRDSRPFSWPVAVSDLENAEDRI